MRRKLLKRSYPSCYITLLNQWRYKINQNGKASIQNIDKDSDKDSQTSKRSS